MDFWLTLLLFGLLVVGTHFLEGVTGFGSTVLSMPFATMLLGVDIAKPVLALYALLTCLYVLFYGYKDIDWGNYAKMMAVLIVGLPIGIFLYNWLPQTGLMILLGVFMAAVAARGLRLEIKGAQNKKPMKDFPALCMVFLGGIAHGAYASGGPLVIIYATEKIEDKSRFRATLCLIWVTLNTLLLAQMFFANQITGDVVNYALYGFIFLAAGTVVGVKAHDHIKGDTFKKITYGILLIMGLVTLVLNLI